MNKLEIIGKRIRDERLKHHWLISQLSEHTGLSIAHISSIERGKYNFSVDSLIKLADVLKVSVDYILFGGISPNENIPEYLNEIIRDCNSSEMHILIDNAKCLKEIIRKHGN